MKLLFLILFFTDLKAQVFIPFGFWRGNSGPTISTISNQKAYEGNLTNIPFTIGHKSGYPLACSASYLSVTSSNLTAMPLSGISFAGTFPFCYVNFNAPSGSSGTSTIVLTIRDNAAPTLQASTTFTVTVYNVLNISINPSIQIIPRNSTFQFNALSNYSDGTAQSITASATWSTPVLVSGTAPTTLTSNLGLITVGTVTSPNYPKYTYTVTYGVYSATANMTFNPSTINGLFTTPISSNINVGGNLDVKCFATTVDGGVLDITNSCDWTSNNNPVANVNNFALKGRVYGNALGGPALITATYSSFNDTTSITVDANAPTPVEEGTGLYGRYYSTISGGAAKEDPYSALVNSRIDGTIAFVWNNINLNPAGGLDDFGARWSGQMTASSAGLYCIQTRSDDGLRLWIGNSLVINNWTDHAATLNSGSYTFLANVKTEIFAEFYENSGNSEMHVRYIFGACGTAVTVPRINLFPIATRALDIQQNVVPFWANLRRGFTMNGTVGAIANGATITGFTNGAASPVNATASNVNGTGMAYAATERSQSVGFDGVDDSISVVASTVATGTGARSEAVWINPTNLLFDQNVFGYGTVGLNNSYGLSVLTTGALQVYGGGGSNCTTAAAAVPALTWTHIVTVYTAGTATIYKNGALIQTCNALSWNTPTGSTLYIGAGTALTNIFSGYIDDIAFWNNALGAGEINSLYEKQRVINP